MITNMLKKAFLDYHHRTSRIPQGERVTGSLTRHIGKVDSLLDIGCGDGQNTLRIANMVGATKVAGVDVHVRENTYIDVQKYDGLHIPFPDGSFDAVILVDVLHHCTEPQTVLKEAVRVARKKVAIKDHFRWNYVTNKLLYFMDIAGNAKDGIFSPGTYFEPRQWVEMANHAGARIVSLDWPLKTHDLPWRVVGWPTLQFTALLEPVRPSSQS